MKLAIVGAGALGCAMGCVLTLNGCKEVTLVEVDKDRVDLIRKEGINIILPDRSEHTVRTNITAHPAEVGICDVVQISVKGYHTDSAMAMSMPMIGPDTQVLSVQNGLGNLDIIAKYVGRSRVIGGVTAHSAQLLGPNTVRYAGGMGYVYVGRIDGHSDEKLFAVAEFYTRYGFKTDVSEEPIDIPIWRKLVANVANNAFLAITGMTGNEALACEEAKEFMTIVAEEMATVARAKGYHIDILSDPGGWALKTLTGVKDNKVSMLQDLEAGRKTEIDNLNYAIVKMGRELGIATPYNLALSLQIKAIEGRNLTRRRS